jgi:serine/threonine-protein kinase
MTTSGGLSREVAVKLLLSSIDPGSVLRLRDEARLLAALNHRAIVQVYDLVTVEGRPALITEYIDGTDLSGVIHASGPVPVKVALEIVGDVAGALNAALTTPAPSTGALWGA